LNTQKKQFIFSGISAKYLKENYIENESNAFAFDIGIIYPYLVLYKRNFSIGISVQNIGSKIKFYDSEYPLPLIFNFNFGGDIIHFGDIHYFELVKAFYNENKNLRPVIIDSFSSYSDYEKVYPFMLSQIVEENEKIKNSAIEWFEKAFEHQILLPWIVDSYVGADFKTKRFFEKIFAKELPKLFYDERISYRIKLCYLKARSNNEF
jgi:hypothetical protein